MTAKRIMRDDFIRQAQNTQHRLNALIAEADKRYEVKESVGIQIENMRKSGLLAEIGVN